MFQKYMQAALYVSNVLEGECTSPANSSSMGTRNLRSTWLAMKNSLQV